MNDAAWPLVGAFEADAWAGLVFCVGPGRGVAVRLLVEHEGTALDPRDLFLRVHEVGPHEPHGAYARVAFDLRPDAPATLDVDPPPVAEGEASLVWEWARLDSGTVVGRVSVARPMRLRLQIAPPWDWSVGDTRVGVEVLAPRKLGRVSFPGVVWPATPEPAVSSNVEIRPDRISAPQGSPPAVAIEIAPRAPALFRLVEGPASALVPARDGPDTGEDSVSSGAENTPDPIFSAGPHAAIDRARDAWEATRVHVTGAWDGLAAAVSNNLHWMTLLQPETARRYVPAGRRWIFPQPDGTRDHWTVFAWDGFFNALLASLDDHALACDMVEAVLDTQYPSGNVPNWRSRLGGTPDRSQPPIGAFIVSRIVLRSGDLALARRALPGLRRWHAWWSGDGTRTGRRRPSGLFAWGSDVDRVNAWVPSWERDASHRQKAAWESGQDDLPNWDGVEWDDTTNTLALDCVDLSALLALDAECLAVLLELTGDAARAAAYRREHARLCALIDARLWDEARGVYADRLPDGRFSDRIAASNFYPLLAGAAQGTRLARALDALTDPDRFWGTWVVPTISRQDPAHPDQQYWRGTIWPPVNLLLYEALRRVGADQAAAHLARRSVALFLGDWRARQVCRENFSSVDGRGGGQRHQSWGPLFAWTGLSEFADHTPWDGLRLGTTHVQEASAIDRLALCGHEWRIALAPDRTAVSCDRRPWFTADAPVCLRQVRIGDRRWQASLSSARDVRLAKADGTALHFGAGTHEVDGTL